MKRIIILVLLMVLLAGCRVGPPAAVTSAWSPPVNASNSPGDATQRVRLAGGPTGMAAAWMEGVLNQATGPAMALVGGPWEWVGPHSQPGYVNPSLAVGPDGTAYVAWAGLDHAPYDVYFAERAPGQAWSVPYNLSNSPSNCVYPDILLDGSGTLWVVWQDSLSDTNAELYFAARPAGEGWTGAQRITYNAVQDLNVRIAEAPAGPVIVWRQSGRSQAVSIDAILSEPLDKPLAGSWEILESHWTSAGWSEAFNVSANAKSSHFADLATAGDSLYVVWEQEVGEDLFDVVLRRADNGSWLPAVTISQGPKALYPAIDVAGSYVAVAWTDYRLGRAATFYNHSADGGLTFAGDEHVSGSPVAVHYPDADICNGVVYLAWQDARSGSLDIWLATLAIGPAPTPAPVPTPVPVPTGCVCPTPVPQVTCVPGCYYK